jgi:hypothetical protein
LRDGVYKQLKLREWTFAGFDERDMILLAYERYGYLWEAKIEDIDWDEYRMRKERNSGPEQRGIQERRNGNE